MAIKKNTKRQKYKRIMGISLCIIMGIGALSGGLASIINSNRKNPKDIDLRMAQNEKDMINQLKNSNKNINEEQFNKLIEAQKKDDFSLKSVLSHLGEPMSITINDKLINKPNEVSKSIKDITSGNIKKNERITLNWRLNDKYYISSIVASDLVDKSKDIKVVGMYKLAYNLADIQNGVNLENIPKAKEGTSIKDLMSTNIPAKEYQDKYGDFSIYVTLYPVCIESSFAGGNLTNKNASMIIDSAVTRVDNTKVFLQIVDGVVVSAKRVDPNYLNIKGISEDKAKELKTLIQDGSLTIDKFKEICPDNVKVFEENQDGNISNIFIYKIDGSQAPLTVSFKNNKLVGK